MRTTSFPIGPMTCSTSPSSSDPIREGHSDIVGAPGYGLPYNAANDRLRRDVPEVKFTPADVAVDALYDWYAANQSGIDQSMLLVDK